MLAICCNLWYYIIVKVKSQNKVNAMGGNHNEKSVRNKS